MIYTFDSTIFNSELKNLDPARHPNESFNEYKTRQARNNYILNFKKKLGTSYQKDFNTGLTFFTGTVPGPNRRLYMKKEKHISNEPPNSTVSESK